MLSNLTPKSNVLPLDTYQGDFSILSAMDLHDIRRRCPNIGVSFDPTNGTLTPEQRQEWKAHLFWGDKVLTMAEEDRASWWPVELALAVLPLWQSVGKVVSVEEGIEWLWLCTQVTGELAGRHGGEPLVQAVVEKATAIQEAISEFLVSEGMDSTLQAQRLEQITGG